MSAPSRPLWTPTIITDYTPGVASGMADAAGILNWPISGYTNLPLSPHPCIQLTTTPVISNFDAATIALYVGDISEPTPVTWQNTIPIVPHGPILASTVNYSEVCNYWEESQRWDTVFAIRYAIYHDPATWIACPTIHVAGPRFHPSHIATANTFHEQTREWFLWIARRISGQLECPDMEPESRRRFLDPPTTREESRRYVR